MLRPALAALLVTLACLANAEESVPAAAPEGGEESRGRRQAGRTTIPKPSAR